MAVPKYNELFRPVLASLQDGTQRHWKEILVEIARSEGLTQEQLEELDPQGNPKIRNRIHWAITYLFQSRLVDRPIRAHAQITSRGLEALKKFPHEITLENLKIYPEYLDFIQRVGTRSTTKTESPESPENRTGSETDTPQERISHAADEMKEIVASELVARIHMKEPLFMEHVVLDLLVAMGYGGANGDSEHLGRSGDNGVDGVINQDPLGLERIYVQAKRYAPDQTISGADIQSFFGALHRFKASSGVFITTSRFSKSALEFAEMTSPRVVLIDGPKLGQLMVQHKIGVEVKDVIDLVSIDEDFFEEN